MEKQHGIVKFFNEEKGFGFITNNTGQGEVFFHFSQVLGKFMPKKDNKVEFDIVETKKGEAAANVKIVS